MQLILLIVHRSFNMLKLNLWLKGKRSLGLDKMSKETKGYKIFRKRLDINLLHYTAKQVDYELCLSAHFGSNNNKFTFQTSIQRLRNSYYRGRKRVHLLMINEEYWNRHE